MDQEFDDGKFWLPAEFLLDEEHRKPNFTVPNLYAMNMKLNMNSDLGSPVESATETESDEEDYLNELSRKLAQSTLEDGFCNRSKSARVMAGSPQSTLCGYNNVSSRGSSNCPSPAPAPAPAMGRNELPWDVLSAAAGEVARLRLTREAGFNANRKIPSPNSQFHQIQAVQLKKQQMMKQQLLQQQHQQQLQYQLFLQQSSERSGGGKVKPVAPPLSPWPALPQSQPPPPSGSGMRAVFLGNPNTKRGCTGTGVFLPRQIGAPTETRKKRACSTVLLPDRVVHALNLDLQAQPRSNGGFPRHDYDAEMRYRNSVLMAEQRRQQAEKDLRLPQEWTY